ncbi:MAG: hypothetical protein ACK4WK_12030, partial [Anaerolineae bacterium]
WLTAPTPDVGLEVVCREAQSAAECRPVCREARSAAECRPAIGPPGTVVTHELRVRNTGRGDTPDVVVPSVEGADWPTHLSAPYLILPACTSATLTVSVTVPATVCSQARSEAECRFACSQARSEAECRNQAQSGAACRAEVMRRALDWLTAPTPDVGLEVVCREARSAAECRP